MWMELFEKHLLVRKSGAGALGFGLGKECSCFVK